VAAAEVARDDAAKGLLVELGEAKALRDRQAADLPGDLLARYEAAAEAGGGTGVGELSGGACTACRIELSRVDVDRLYRGPNLTTCPQCRRLLVITG
jgi:predicted  nucleic acid-binding Zn-ribbon protein